MEVVSHEQESTDEDKSLEMSNNENENSYADDDEDTHDLDENNQGSISGINQTLSLTSFLFGNIDARGQLEGDVFEPECKRQLASLSRLGLGSLLRQVTNDDDDDEDEDEDDDDEDEQEEEALVKSPSAVDYSDINELVEDEISTCNDDNERERAFFITPSKWGCRICRIQKISINRRES
ncbi:hypothetical protein Anas_01220 [Armadillidium nasatum]|uniref:TAFII-230 TBP-binding domain-containing protein n=1 Tax=Armadillidium nasatum TaxID=96803 RepID=A0A5N5TM71_9CRUS|nr:hypothetical protein Anas_01220 [Armadillidium nasatum]